MNVFIDTNIVGDDYFLRGTKFQALHEYTSRTLSTLYISDVTKEELFKHFKEGLENLFSCLKDAHKFSIRKDFKIISPIEQVKLVENYRHFLDHNHEFDAVSPKIDGTFYNNLVKKAVNNISPFKNGGRGVQDAIIWASFKEVLNKDDKSIAFISNNSNDFGKTKLKFELAQEVQGKSCHFYNSLEEFLDEFGTPIAFINHDYINNFIKSNKKTLLRSVRKSDIVSDNDFERIEKDLGRRLHINNIENVEVKDDIEPVHFYIYKSDQKFYHLAIILGLYVEMEIFTGENTAPSGAKIIIFKEVKLVIDKKTREILKAEIEDFKIES